MSYPLRYRLGRRHIRPIRYVQFRIMKVLIYIGICFTSLTMCKTDKCKCTFDAISTKQLEEDTQILSSSYDGYWKIYGEDDIQNNKEEIIRLESNFFIAPYSKIYIIRKTKESCIMTIKIAQSDLALKMKNYDIILTKEIHLTNSNWTEIKQSIYNSCFWVHEPMTSFNSDNGIPYSLEVKQRKPEPCRGQTYHIVKTEYNSDNNTELNQIFELITQYDSIEDLVSLNKEYAKKSKLKKKN